MRRADFFFGGGGCFGSGGVFHGETARKKGDPFSIPFRSVFDPFSIRFRSGSVFDPFSIRFRSVFDPFSILIRFRSVFGPFSIRFRSVFDPFSMLFRSDFDPISSDFSTGSRFGFCFCGLSFCHGSALVELQGSSEASECCDDHNDSRLVV